MAVRKLLLGFLVSLLAMFLCLPSARAGHQTTHVDLTTVDLTTVDLTTLDLTTLDLTTLVGTTGERGPSPATAAAPLDFGFLGAAVPIDGAPRFTG